MPELNRDHLPTPRSLRVAALAVLVSWFAAVVSTTLAITRGDWSLAIMGVAAACNAMGWWFATRRWVEWATIAVACLATLEDHGIRPWLNGPPDG